MYTRRNVRWGVIFRFVWWRIIFFTVWSVGATTLFVVLNSQNLDCSLPLAPLGTIGVAVAFYIGFKNNQSYDRYWEARKIWGGIVNVSRSWGNQAVNYVSKAHTDQQVSPETPKNHHKDLIYRHIAWVNVLRYQLRRDTPWGYRPKGLAKKYSQPTDVAAMKSQVQQLMPESELTVVCSSKNAATQILRKQGEHLTQLIEQEPRLIEEFRLISMMDLITEMYTLQGKCERIKNTPFPRQYAYFSLVFTWIFILLLPFGIVGEFASQGALMVWLTVPMSVIIMWIFLTMEAIGDSSEDPFQNFINDVPMTALCRTIEIDLREMLGEKDLPESLQPVNDILM